MALKVLLAVTFASVAQLSGLRSWAVPMGLADANSSQKICAFEGDVTHTTTEGFTLQTQIRARLDHAELGLTNGVGTVGSGRVSKADPMMLHDLQTRAFPELLTSEDWNDFAACENLTSRELEALRLVCRGMSNRAIADRMGIQAPTLRSHLRAVYRKLSCHDRTQAVLRVFHELNGGRV